MCMCRTIDDCSCVSKMRRNRMESEKRNEVTSEDRKSRDYKRFAFRVGTNEVAGKINTKQCVRRVITLMKLL